MSVKKLDKQVLRYMEITIAGILLILPFHGFLTVWVSSFAGHYTLLRLWKEVIVALLCLGTVYLLAKDKTLRTKLFASNLVKLTLLLIGIILIYSIFELIQDTTTAKAVGYGLIVDARFLVFFLVCLVVSAKSSWLKNNAKVLILVPAIAVAAFAIAQYLILPYDFLKHFGYNDTTISAYETINNNLEHIRVASTLRGANPLGAYIILPLSLIAVLLFREKKEIRDKIMIGIGLVMALVFSFSRSAWIGAGVAIGLLIWLQIRSKKISNKVYVLAGLVIAVIVGGAFLLKDSSTFENVFLHTEEGSVNVSSNEGHLTAFKNASRDVVNSPLGSGVGTAGPQSVYNNAQSRIAENFYLQIGQEIGIIGMALFIAVIILVGRLLWQSRVENLNLALFVSLVGLCVTNLFLHAWTDDTLSYIFFGLAGISLAPVILKPIKHKPNAKSK